MKLKHLIVPLFLLSAVFLAACSTEAVQNETMPNEEMMSESTAEPMKDESMDEEMTKEEMVEDETAMEKDEMVDHQDEEMTAEKDEMGSGEGEAMNSEMMEEKDESMKDESMAEEGMMTPEWFNAVLTNAKTGETFTIADYKGQVVLVETLAMWCSNCLKQQMQVDTLHDLLGERDDFISLGIDIDPNENAAALKSYTEQNGFDWLYTVAPIDVAREIGQLYGAQFLNPPSTPMLIIDRNGETHPLPFGIKSAESLLAALEPFLGQ